MSGAASREQLLKTARNMSTAGFNVGTAGNASVRVEGGMLITPSGMAAETCTADDLVFITTHGAAQGHRAPSSEWRMHRDVYIRHPEAGAIVHTHAPFATALACQRLEIPPFHYMIARFGGNTVRCADYATFGTQALSDAVCAALEARSACLMANHGMLVFGRNAEHALAMALEFESLCEQYWRTLQLGAPILLSEAQMREVTKQFGGYGKPR